MRISDWSSDVCSSDLLFVQSDCTHLLFVDADIDFAAADIFALIGAMMARPDCAILGAAVPRRTVNWPQVARAAQRGLAKDNAADLARFAGDFALSFLNADQRSEEHTSELQSLMRRS